jgi:hypothetical protein
MNGCYREMMLWRYHPRSQKRMGHITTRVFSSSGKMLKEKTGDVR